MPREKALARARQGERLEPLVVTVDAAVLAVDAALGLLVCLELRLRVRMVGQVRLVQPVDVAVVEEEGRVEGGMHERLERILAQDVHHIVRRLHCHREARRATSMVRGAQGGSWQGARARARAVTAGSRGLPRTARIAFAQRGRAERARSARES